MKFIFTQPPECVFSTPDNSDGNLVVSKGDYIVKSESLRYMAIELLGVGTFGQVFRCVSNEGEEVAIKVVKSYNRFYQYEMNEVRILKRLKDDKLNQHFVELYDAFVYKQHLCIVLELLSKNMYDLTKILRFKGMDYISVRVILKQLLEGLHELHKLGITHCDLKPENILVADLFSLKVKIIDFGSSSTRPMSNIFYVQSRFYRAPEVILGIPYSAAIDMWSFGCIAYELVMGHPLFPGHDNKDQILRIHEFFQDGLPFFMLEHGTNTFEYFEKENNFYSRENPSKITVKTISNRISAKPFPQIENDLFLDLILQALNPSYMERTAPHMLLKHPFLSYSELATVPHKDIDVRVEDKKIPSTNQNPRKMSMFNYGFLEEETAIQSIRKGSVFDPNHENRGNRPL